MTKQEQNKAEIVPEKSATETYSQVTPMQTLGYIIKTMRPKQWSKNGIVFAGLVFSLHLKPGYWGQALVVGLAFFLFCLISSSVYILNDLVDIEKDRQHERKRNRPLPSGKLKPWEAKIAFIVLLSITFTTSFLILPLLSGLPGVNTPSNILDEHTMPIGFQEAAFYFGSLVFLYFLLQVAYNAKLKNVVILDVFTVASGFVIRAIAGAVVIRVQISYWFYLVIVLGALFLALSKRRHELVLLGTGAGGHRKILEEYSTELIQEMVSVVTTSMVIAYSLYTYLGETVPKNHLMMLTIPFVLYGVFRYLYLVYRKDEGGSPDELLLKDKPLFIDIVLWGLLVIVILYFFNDPQIRL